MKYIKFLLSFLPSKLPVGMTEFNSFANDVIELAGEFADRDSMRFAIASMVIHLDSKRGSVPKRQLVNMLRKSAANQVASQVFQELKQKQLDAQKAEQEQAAATAQPEQVANATVDNKNL